MTPLGGGPEQYAYFETLRSRECVINLPTTDLVNEVIGIGNCSGAEVDKFEAFGLTPRPYHNCERPVDQGVLCEFRMPPDQRQPDFEVRPIYLRGS